MENPTTAKALEAKVTNKEKLSSDAAATGEEYQNTIFYFDVGDDLYIIHTGEKTGATGGTAGQDDTCGFV